MESLKSYLSIIDPRLLNHMVGQPRQFIRLFQQHKFLSEEAFAHMVCGEKHSRSYYTDLKSRTIKILQGLAFIGTSKGANPVKKKYDICQKKFTIGQKFLNKGERNEGLRLVKQAYRLAVDYDFVHLACELSSILYHDHIYYHRNPKKAKFYAQQVEKYLQDYTTEKKAEHYYYQIIGKTNNLSQQKEVQNAINCMKDLQGASIKYKVYEYSVQVYYGYNIGDFNLVIGSCTEMLRFIDHKKGVYTSHYHFFLLNRGIAQLVTAQYEAAANSFQQAEKYAPRKSFNDYLLRLYKILNLLHGGQYQKAYELYQKSKKCPYEMIYEQLTIIEAYFCFLSYTGYLELGKAFRLGKYLNDTFKAQEDKQGDNINVLIAELLVYLSRDRGKFIDRIEAVKNYSYRHLRGEETKRAKWFIKILCMMPRVDFQPAALQRLAHKQIQSLKDHPISMGEGFTIEIIPFNDLLDMILLQLNKKVA